MNNTLKTKWTGLRPLLMYAPKLLKPGAVNENESVHGVPIKGN